MTDTKTIVIPVRGDSGSQYECTLTTVRGRLCLHCTCQAGENGTLCKHRVELLTGKYARARSSGVPESTLEEFAGMINGSSLAKAFAAKRAELAAAQKQLQAIKAEITARKKGLASLLDRGAPD